MSALAQSRSETRVWSRAVTHRVLLTGITVLVFLPSVLFAWGLKLLPACAIVLGSCAGTAIVAAGRPIAAQGFLSGRLDVKRFSLSIVAACALLVLGGELHLVFTTWDWLTRDAVLADLVANGFPVAYKIAAADYLLRAPLGMYMLPAVVGHMAGLWAAHGALLAQNSLFLGAIFYVLASIGRGSPHVIILTLFAGVSIVGALLRAAWSPPQAIPFWLQWGLDSWHPMFQFSGTLVQFFWVPNHALPAWWLATLMLLQVRGQIDVATLGVTVAGALFWSPLSVVPLVPWLAFCAVRAPRETLSTPRTWIGMAAGLCFVPVALYFVLGSSSISGGSHAGRPDFPFWYGLFVLVELPVLAFLVVLRDRIAREDRRLLIVSAAVLLVLPFFRFGPNNDLVMRSSIVPLVVVAFIFGAVVVDETRRRSKIAVAGWLLVAIAAPSAAVEIGRALSTPRYAISDCTLMQASRELDGDEIPTNYVVPMAAVPTWLMDTGHLTAQPVSEKSCWPDRIAPRFLGTTFGIVSGARPGQSIATGVSRN